VPMKTARLMNAGYAASRSAFGCAAVTSSRALGTNDQGKVWLNGKEVFKFAETRVLKKDPSRVEVTLVKGQNALVLKVVNEIDTGRWPSRFLKDGQAGHGSAHRHRTPAGRTPVARCVSTT